MHARNRRRRTSQRDRFLERFRILCGNETRVLWTPRPTDRTNVLDDSRFNNPIIWDGDVQARLSRLGLGYAQSFNGSSHAGRIADAVHLSFGDGTTNTPLTFFAVVNITDTAALRLILAKEDFAANSEFTWRVQTTDIPALFILDESAAVTSSRAASGAATQGAWVTLAVTYDGATGALAGSGINVYENGASVNSTASNNASYVAMENLAAPLGIGANWTTANGGGNWFSGSMALVAAVRGAMSPGGVLQLHNLCRNYFRF